MYTTADNRNIKTIEMKKAAMDAIGSMMETNPDILFFEADLGHASGSFKLQERFPDQYVQCGIAEANMCGMAAAMSSYGFVPFIHSFAPFASRRIYDQVFLSGGYGGNTLNILATDPGFTVGANGGTHTTFEDVAMMTTIPNAVVCDACDPVQLDFIVRSFAQSKGIHYVRTSRKTVRPVYDEGSRFEMGKGNILRQGNDVLIVAAGQLVSDALDAADLLQAQGIDVEVIDMFCIKPLDKELLIEEARGKRAVVTFENHSIHGGLGSLCAEALMEAGVAVTFKRHGIEERYGQVGPVDFLQKEFHLTAQDLIETIESLLENTAGSLPVRNVQSQSFLRRFVSSAASHIMAVLGQRQTA